MTVDALIFEHLVPRFLIFIPQLYLFIDISFRRLIINRLMRHPRCSKCAVEPISDRRISLCKVIQLLLETLSLSILSGISQVGFLVLLQTIDEFLKRKHALKTIILSLEAEPYFLSRLFSEDLTDIRW